MNLLLLQMSIVLIVTVGCGWVARQLGQARVIGEIIEGILIGPSVFGRFAPHLSVQTSWLRSDSRISLSRSTPWRGTFMQRRMRCFAIKDWLRCWYWSAAISAFVLC